MEENVVRGWGLSTEGIVLINAFAGTLYGEYDVHACVFGCLFALVLDSRFSW